MKIGDRVVISDEALRRRINRKFPRERIGVIVGENRRQTEWLVLWQGNHIPAKMAKFFVMLASDYQAARHAGVAMPVPPDEPKPPARIGDEEYDAYIQELEACTGVKLS